MTEPAPDPGPTGVLPDVSIVIPAYNVAPWIGAALESVMRQTFPSWEAIVVNDGSPDTPALERALTPFRDRITYKVQPNRGTGAARNQALRLARGKWVAFLDGDDAWAPEFLSHQLDHLTRDSLDMTWSDGWLVGQGMPHGGRLMQRSPCRGPVTLLALIQQTVSVTTSATVVRRELVEQAGGFDETLVRGQDFDLWARLVHGGARVGYNTMPLVEYRVRRDSLSGDPVTQAERALAVLARLRSKLGPEVGPDIVRALEERIADLQASRDLATGKRHLLRGEYALARAAFEVANERLASLKLSAALLGLRLAPSAIRRVVQLRDGRADQ